MKVQFASAAAMLSMTHVALMRSHYDGDTNTRFVVVHVALNGFYTDENHQPVETPFFVKIAAKNDIVSGFIECSTDAKCKTTYRDMRFHMYTVELYKFMTEVYKKALDELKDCGHLNTEGYIYQGKPIRKYYIGNISEEAVANN